MGFAGTSVDSIVEAAGVSKLILYRHFDSKEALYRCVLERVVERLSEEFAAALEHGGQDRAAVRGLLAVGREDPDGFRLLWRHAAREPEFAPYVGRFRLTGVGATRGELEGHLSDPKLLEWAAETMFAFVVEAMLAWLDHGDPASDDEFVDVVTASGWALIDTWRKKPSQLRRRAPRRLRAADQQDAESD